MSATAGRRLGAGLVVLAVGLAGTRVLVSQDSPRPAAASLPEVTVETDGTVRWGPRSIPPPALASAEAREAYARQMLGQAAARQSRTGATAPRDASEAAPGTATPDRVGTRPSPSKERALKTYPDVEVQEQKIGDIDVSVYAPKVVPPRNRDKVAMELEVDAEAIAVASLARMKVMAVHYRLRPALASHQDIVAVYRELLKTYKPRNIALFGTSGGCLLAQTTVLWLPELKLPLPGALGLVTCAGGTSPGDTRFTNNGLDPLLSTAFRGLPPFGGGNRGVAGTRQAGEPPATPLEGEIPRGYPPAFLLAGTRDMCLSETVLLHRKLRNAGVEADLNVFEGMWHAFHANTDLPESREAMAALARFFALHLGKEGARVAAR